MPIQIEKNVPTPTSTGRGPPSEVTAACLIMEVGDSFIMDAPNQNIARSRIFTGIRKTGDKFRVWRIS